MLILVIVILVLLALMGTAMISTSRTDRVATQQNAVNTQIDLLVESVKTMAKGAITTPMYGTIGTKPFRPTAPASDTTYLTGYHNWVSYGPNTLTPTPDNISSYDPYLASRVPNYPSSTGNVCWPFITNFLAGSSFESPYAAAGQVPVYTARTQMDLGSLTISGFNYPAFVSGAYTYLAGDADGDGIADSGLFRLPGVTLNGVTYYAAVRIIDNNSAINASTAWSSSSDFNFSSTAIPNVGLFPSNVGLAQLLYDYSPTATTPATISPQMAIYNTNYRFNGSSSAQQSVFADDGSARNDFNFYSQGDALNCQLARRILNPGHKTVSNTNMYKAPLADMFPLAYRFCLKNSTVPPSVLESASTGLPSSLYSHPDVHAVGYLPSQYPTWYQDNFDWENSVNGKSVPRPIRSITVVRNGTSNQISAHSMAGISSYTTPQNALIEVLPQSELMPNYTTTPAAVAKVSVNTAPFNILWRGFWNVMVDNDSSATPASNSTAPPQPPSATILNNTADGWGMFRNTLRDPDGAVKMTSQEVMMLRSAIAAMNTIDLRDNDFTVSSRHITIRDALSGAAKYEATVFGGEPQPFITEVYANTDIVTPGLGGPNPKGYVAIELHNPYPYAISLARWNLGIINRHNFVGPPQGTYPQLKITALTGFTGFPVVSPPVIPPNGYIVLENYSAIGGVGNYARSRPAEMGAPPPANVYYVAGLEDVLYDPTAPAPPTAGSKPGGELVLLRPRRAVYVAGTTTAPPMLECDALTKTGPLVPANSAYDEANLYDLVPADSFDFTNLALPTTAAALPAGEYYHAIHYIRGSGPANPWKFVYPGIYTASTGVSTPDTTLRQAGALTVHWGGDSLVPVDPWVTSGQLFNFGVVEPTLSTYTNGFPGIQWANQDAAGWNMTSTYPYGTLDGAKVTSVGPPITPASPYVPGSVAFDGSSLANSFQNQFPFGQFARNGDMLQIPFIGAYKIRQSSVADATVFLEMNSVSMDSSFADDQDAPDDLIEAVGRFCPIWGLNPTYEDSATTTDATDTDRYRWTKDFFDYFTVSAPGDDYLPNVDPNPSDTTIYSLSYTPGVAESANRYPYDKMNLPPLTPAVPAPVPVANVGTTGSTPLTLTEETAPVEGLISINTSSWKVLSALPFTPTAGPVATVAEQANNVAIAKLIVDWRDGTNISGDSGSPAGWTGAPHGPFRSIYDLNRVVMKSNPARGFQNALGTSPFAADPGNQQGDMSPYTATSPYSTLVGYTHNPSPVANKQPSTTTDIIRDDFEEKFLILNRVSNLVTIRSDMFTVYILVQGWRNIGTPTPELVVQRRAAIIVDRNPLTTSSTGSGGSVNVFTLPTD